MNETNENSSINFDISVERDENLARIEIATLSIIFVVTIIGNTSVLFAIWMKKRYGGRKKLSRMYLFIQHLCIADLITAFLSVLPQLIWKITFRFNGGFVLCKLIKFGQTLGPYLSSYILIATAIDRHQAICYPLTYSSWSFRISKIMIYLAWIISLIFCLPQLFIFSYEEVRPNIFDCWATFPEPWGEKAYVTWYCISIFTVPLIVLTLTYSLICRTIWKSSSSNLRFQDSRRLMKGKKVPPISRAKINTIKQTVAVIAIYIMCSSPFISAQLWATWDPQHPFSEGSVFVILTLLYSLNSCVNPWIYLAFNRELVKFILHPITFFNGNNIRNFRENSCCYSGNENSFQMSTRMSSFHNNCSSKTRLEKRLNVTTKT